MQAEKTDELLAADLAVLELYTNNRRSRLFGVGESGQKLTDALQRIRDRLVSRPSTETVQCQDFIDRTGVFEAASHINGVPRLEYLSRAKEALSVSEKEPGKHVAMALTALKPFADICDAVVNTNMRDGEVVHRQQADHRDALSPYMELCREDFRRAKATYAALAAAIPAVPEKEQSDV